MNIRALIVDDEPLARERIRSMLRSEPGIEIAGEAGSGPEAVSAIQSLKPNLLFLDIQMPGMDGFEVLRHIHRDTRPFVIFVTAFDEHALEAFEIHALDYLLKPFKQARFKEALRRARAALDHDRVAWSENLHQLLSQPRAEHGFLSRLAIKTGDRTLFVKTDLLDFIESAGNYVVLHAGKENHILRETLTALETRLNPKKFIRINRSTIVNIDQIRELRPLLKEDHVVVLHNGKQLPLTRGVRELEERLKFS
jgi:two-component system LytT family response regulator